MSVRTRFAPSPTGYLHLGGARTALFNWLLARQSGGQFVLRVEDTDRERSTDESVQVILDGMKWLNLDYDEGPFFQTRRYDYYRDIVQQLMDSGHAYHCYCTKEELDAMREKAMLEKRKPRYDGTWRDRTGSVPGVDPVVRFKTPLEGTVIINDLVKGPIEIDNAELDDLIICRSDGNPTYNLTVVADDIDMGITHVVRGDDHINNTPRQIHIFNALGATLPKFAHLPMILGDDGKRMSKRHGAVSVTQYKEEGILPDALLNYLARLGWSHGDQELFSIQELIEKFSLENCQRSGSVFDNNKLKWVNQQHLSELDENILGQHLQTALESDDINVSNGPAPAALAALLRERAQTLSEMAAQSRIYYQDDVEYDPKAAQKQLRPVVQPVLESTREALSVVENWQAVELKAALDQVAEKLEVGFGKIGQPLRVALTGTGASPDIAQTLEMIGKARTLLRIGKAIEYVQARAAAQ